MYDYKEDQKPCCNFHPKEVVVGVCCMCLNERLIILASKQSKPHHQYSKSTLRSLSFTQRKKKKNKNKNSPITLPKIFDLSSFLHRFEFRHRKPPAAAGNYDSDGDDDYDEDDASTSTQEDSFISIKFENNGAASWEKGNVSLEDCNKSRNDSEDATKGPNSVVEHAKSRVPSLRWRKRIGHLFQVIRRKRSSKGSVCHVGAKLEGVKVRNGWIRTLTKRRPK